MSSSREAREESNFSKAGAVFWGICGAAFGGMTGAISGLLGSGTTNLLGSGEGHSSWEATKTGAAGSAVVFGSAAFIFGGLYISGALLRMGARSEARAHEKKQAEAERHKAEFTQDPLSPLMFKEKPVVAYEKDDYALVKLGIGLAALYAVSQVAGGGVGYYLRHAGTDSSVSLGQVATDMAVGGAATIPLSFLLAAGSVLGGFAFVVTHFGHGK